MGFEQTRGGGGGGAKMTQHQVVTTELVRQATERLRKLCRTGVKVELRDFFQLCIVLAKSIDSAVVYNQIPTMVHELPQLVRQVFERKDDIRLQPAIMVLMLSVKNACRSGWFRVTDTDELLTMSKELSSRFTSTGELSSPETHNATHIISGIIPRFYPRLSLAAILVSLEAKPGYEVLVVDFHIAKKPASHEKIHLFIARTDNMETSACLVTPPQVNFLLNGRGVEKRSIVSMDTGPQMPTDVTGMLKIGTNLLQAIGEFNGNYIIAITIMSACPSASPASKLFDYVPPAASSFSQDDEIIEGPSKISLHCPISYRRIVTPVKGSMCRHHQCFDYENFMEINSRRPSWRCPYCNRSISCPDLRIDQKMLKVLKEVGENALDVLISGDGSWKAITTSDTMKDLSCEDNDMDTNDTLVSRDSEGKGSIVNNIVDLTIEGSESHGDDILGHSFGSQGSASISYAGRKGRDISDTEERKPDPETLRRICIGDPLPNSLLGNTNAQPSSRFNPQVVGDALARERSQFSMSSGVSMNSMPRRERLRTGVTDSSFAPVLTDAVTPALNRAPVDSQDLTQAGNLLQSLSSTRHFLPAENRDLQLAHSMHGTSSVSTEAERHPNRFVSRAPIAIQALPAQTQVANSFTRPRSNPLRPNSATQVGGSSNNIQQVAPLASLNTTFDTAFQADLERQQLLSRQHPNLQSILELPASPPIPFQSQSQNRELQDRPQRIIQSFPPAMTMQLPTQSGGRNNLDQQRLSASRSSFQLSQEQQNQQQQLLNQWIQQASVQHDSSLRHHQRVPQFQQVPHSNLGSSSNVSDASGFAPLPVLNQHPHPSQRTLPNARPPSVQFSRTLSATNVAFQRGNPSQNADHSRLTVGDQRWNSSTSSLMSRPEGSKEGGIEQAWRPTGRMRGSIVGAGRLGNTTTNPYINQQIASGNTRAFIGSSQSAGQASLVGSTHSNMMQRPPMNAWNPDLVNSGSHWTPNDMTLLRSAGSNVATQMQGHDQNNNTTILAGTDSEWLGLLDLQMPQTDT